MKHTTTTKILTAFICSVLLLSLGAATHDTSATCTDTTSHECQQDTDVQSNSDSITANSDSINQNGQDIQSNSDAISSNDGEIQSNSDAISGNDADIQSNADGVSQNEQDIQSNDADIQSNTDGVAQNGQDIQSNSDAIAQNDQEIQSNSDGVQSNSDAISQNDADIASNSDSISQNGQDIQANSDSISNLEQSTYTKSEVESLLSEKYDSEVVDQMVSDLDESHYDKSEVEGIVEDAESEALEKAKSYADENERTKTLDFNSVSGMVVEFFSNPDNVIKEWVRGNFASKERVQELEQENRQLEARVDRLEKAVEASYEASGNSMPSKVQSSMAVMRENGYEKMSVTDRNGETWDCSWSTNPASGVEEPICVK